MDIALTLASVPAVLAVVNLLKSVGLSGKWSALAAVLIAVGISLSVALFGENAVFQACASGLILGLSAAGLYDVGKSARPPATSKHAREVS